MRFLPLALLIAPIWGQTLTPIQFTITGGAGTNPSGTATISWSQFLNASRQVVYGGSTTITITNGVVNTALLPNDSALPVGCYGIAYSLNGIQSKRSWFVPTSSTPVGQSIEYSLPCVPSQIAQISPGQISAVGALNGYVLTMTATGPNWAAGGGGGGGSPGGTSGQVQFNNAGAFGGFTPAGDCVLNRPNFICTSTNGVPFAPSATIDTTNASNITSGTLAPARGGTGMGALTPGSVPFIGAAGVYSQNNQNFFWNNSTVRLGIGTNNPQAPVDIEGAVSNPSLFIRAGLGSNTLLSITDGNNVNLWHIAASTNGQFSLFNDTLTAQVFAVTPTTNNFLVGGVSDCGFRVCVESSGTNGTMLVNDGGPPPFGKTQFVVRAGTGQSTAMPFQVQNYSGTVIASVDNIGDVVSSQQIISQNNTGLGSSLNGAVGDGLTLSSALKVCWSATASWSSGDDTCFARVSGGVTELNNGTVGHRYATSVQSGQSLVYDNTPSSGISQSIWQNGAGQSTNPLVLHKNNAGTNLSQIGADGSFAALAGGSNIAATVSPTSIGMASNICASWSSAASWSTGTTDSTFCRLNTALVGVGSASSNVGGSLEMASALFAGSISGVVTIQPATAAGTWSLTLPTSGGSAGQVLQTNGSGVTSWATVAGAGTVTHTLGPLTSGAVIIGNGGGDIAALASLGTTTTLLHGNASGNPTFGPVVLTTDVSGILPFANGGVGTNTNFTNHQFFGNNTGSTAAPVATQPTFADLAAGTVGAKATFPGGDLFCGSANPQSGTSYAFLASDECKLVTFNNGSSTAVTLSVATTTGFTAGAFFDTYNIGAGTVTITPTTSTINGGSTIVLNQGQGAHIVSDGTNYSAWVSAAPSGSGTVTSITFNSPITGGTVTSTGTVGCATCVTSAASLTSNQLVIGGGSQASAALGSLGTTTTVLHGNSGGAPAFGAVVLTTDVSGVLPAGNLPTATSGAKGIVQGDGSTLTISAGTISCTTATSSQIGCAKPDGTILTISAGAETVAKASSSAFGVVEVDGTTITASGGVISATGGSGSTAICSAAGTNTYTCSIAGFTLVTGSLVNLFVTNTNTSGTVTLNINSGGAVTVQRGTGNNPAIGQIVASSTPILLSYNGTVFQVVNDSFEAGSSGLVTLTRTAYPWTIDVNTGAGALCAMASACTPTGYWNMSGGQIRLPESTVGSLPTASSNTGKEFIVTDGATASDCTTGSGSVVVNMCRSNGSAWVFVGASGISIIDASIGSDVGNWAPYGYQNGATPLTFGACSGSNCPTVFYELPPAPLFTFNRLVINDTGPGGTHYVGVALYSTTTGGGASSCNALVASAVLTFGGGGYDAVSFGSTYQMQPTATYILAFSSDTSGGTLGATYATNSLLNPNNPASLAPKVFTGNTTSWSGGTPTFPSTCGTRTSSSVNVPLVMFARH